MTKPLIVGVDIGTTTGIAIYDLKRNLLYVGSKRHISISEIINQITKFGSPLIIATDKKKIPSKIKKLIAIFNCRVFKPDHDLTLEEKDRIVNISIKNPHQKDALAAATFAYKRYAGQFASIDKSLESKNLRQYSDKVKKMIINREAGNIADAIEKIKPKEEVEVKHVVQEVYLNWKEKAKKSKKKLDDQKRRYDILKTYTEKLEENIKSLKKQKKLYLEEEMKKNEDMRKKVIKEKEIMKRDILIKQLQFELSKQKSFLKLYEDQSRKQQELRDIENEDLIPVVVVPNFTKELLVIINKEFGIKNKIIWFQNVKHSRPPIKTLISFKPKIVIAEISDNAKKTLKNSGIIVIDGIEPEMRTHYATVSPKDIENTIKKVEKKDFLNWLEDYRGR